MYMYMFSCILIELKTSVWFVHIYIIILIVMYKNVVCFKFLNDYMYMYMYMLASLLKQVKVSWL